MSMAKASIGRMLLLAVIAAGAGCKVHQTSVPGLSGPSELALAIAVVAVPDTIRQDGSDWSTIVVTARDKDGAAVPSVEVRLDIQTASGPADYGTLSSRTLVTGADGRATATYTSPPTPPVTALPEVCPALSFGVSLLGPCVGIAATPVGESFYTFPTQVVFIHLVPPSVILPPANASNPVAAFEFEPSAPRARDVVVVDASASHARDGKVIVDYEWNWGDGEVENSPTPDEEHDFVAPGVYKVVLTVTDSAGLTGSVTKNLTVSP